MKYVVYLIESAEGYRYTGVTENLVVRLQQHNDHTLSFWTKRGTNWRVVYNEEFEEKSSALKRERWLKTGAGRAFLKGALKQMLTHEK